MENRHSIRVLSLVLVLNFLQALCSLSSWADERILPEEVFRAMGYQAVPAAAREVGDVEPARGTPWPVAFADAAHTIAQNFVTFQEYDDGNPYFHGGCDVRTKNSSDVKAPVDGVLEGGYYGYSVDADGSLQKQWQPWNGQTQHDPYFELALVTDAGYRYEMHHVDSENLPEATLRALSQGGVRIRAGTVLGKVNSWAFPDYTHIHFNIIRPDGTILNPEYYSAPVADHTPPVIHGVYAVAADGSAQEIQPGARLSSRPAQIVVSATDSHDNDAYVQTPPFIQLTFSDAVGTAGTDTWDFRKVLKNPDGGFPEIREVFDLDGLTLPDGEQLTTSGQYGVGVFLIRLPIAPTASGPFEITVADTTGNQTQFQAELNP